MSIFQGDLIIKTAIELGLEDIRNNPWLIDHMLGDILHNTYLKEKYGKKQVDACKEWLLNNQIEIYMADQGDHNNLPCVTIMLGSSNEKPEMKTMADQSPDKIVLLPNKIGKPIPYVVKPFVPLGYDEESGLVELPDTTVLGSVSEGMILVNPANGTGYPIQSITAEGVMIEPGLEIKATQLGIVPKFQYYEARIEHSYFQETYTIGCHVHGDPQRLLWLHSIILYSLVRYREGMFEANGFSEGIISSSDMVPNDFFSVPGGEKAWSRYITLTGQVENSWVKSPRRKIETVALSQPAANSNGVDGGIIILSNLDSPEFIDKTEELWYTEEDDSPEDE